MAKSFLSRAEELKEKEKVTKGETPKNSRYDIAIPLSLAPGVDQSMTQEPVLNVSFTLIAFFHWYQ